MSEETKNSLVIYQSNDGKIRLNIDLHNETFWLTQKQMAELFQREPHTIGEHIKNIFEEKELPEDFSTYRNFRVVQEEGGRQVSRNIDHYNLDMVISVGYRVNSAVATHFRQWATQTLKEYIIKGFVIDDERLKNPKGWDYFDELLERIREIRASEKRFYQKIKDLFALSIDYKDDIEASNTFFATVQNKLLYAVTGNTAAELIVSRADADSPNMNLTNWRGSRVRKQDVITAKNYLLHDEIKKLDRLVVMFIDYAEDKAERRQQLRMSDWKNKIDKFLDFNDYEILSNRGKVSKEDAEKIAHARYEEFDTKRRKQEAIEADKQDLRELEELETEMKEVKKLKTEH